nr:cytochrome c [uncultured Helicobacter sp.]
MSKKLMLYALVVGFIHAQSEILSLNEYGKNLYENPRGIACSKCHGASGEPTIIAHYKHKGIEKTLLAPRINNIEFSIFEKALKKQKGVMPTYYLTDEEIKAIYMYLYRP